VFRLVSTPIGKAIVFAGLGVGGLWEGAARPLAVTNSRLRLDRVLNGVTRRETLLGNSARVLGRLSPTFRKHHVRVPVL